MTQITKQSTNYKINAENETLKLEGQFSINQENVIENYNTNIYDNTGAVIGSTNYSEYDGNVNYNYNVLPDYKAAVMALLDASIISIKTELIK